jgi:signal transduction histidine kinase
MHERAALLGGQLSVDSATGGPTRVTAVLPLASPVATAPAGPADHVGRRRRAGLLR